MKLNDNHYISMGLAVTLLGVAVTGGIAWGQMDEKITNIEEKQKEQSGVQKQIHEIDSNQRLLIFKQEQAKEDQDEFQDDTKKALEQIIRKLDQQN